MKALLVAAALLAGSAAAGAEPLPPGSIGLQGGLLRGTGADASRVGFGYQVGAQAAWQPMATEQRIGWSARWNFMYGWLYDAKAARVDDALKELQMELLLGVRVRPGKNPSRYLTLHGGAELFRSDQVLPPAGHRAFVGGVASVGLDIYKWSCLFSLEVRASQIGGAGPTTLGLVLGIGKTGG